MTLPILFFPFFQFLSPVADHFWLFKLRNVQYYLEAGTQKKPVAIYRNNLKVGASINFAIESRSLFSFFSDTVNLISFDIPYDVCEDEFCIDFFMIFISFDISCPEISNLFPLSHSHSHTFNNSIMAKFAFAGADSHALGIRLNAVSLSLFARMWHSEIPSNTFIMIIRCG